MSRFKSTAATIAVTATLLLGILALVPEAAEAATIPDLASSGLSTSDSFTLTATVKIPAGEHVPLDYAKVLVAPKTASLSSGILDTPFCIATTGGGASAVITNVVGGTATQNSFTGYGYAIAGADPGFGSAYGYGFAKGKQSQAFAGYGFGYGSTSDDVTVEVTITVTGCNFFTGGPSGDPASASETFRVQAFVGSGASNALASYPLTAIFANPDYTPPANTEGTLVGDGSGVTVVGGPVKAGTTSGQISFPDGGPIKSMAVTPSKDLPAGSKITIRSSTDVDTKKPQFGVPNLLGQFPTIKPVMQFQPVLENPDGSTTTDLNGVLKLEFITPIPRSYFQDLVTKDLFPTEALAVRYFQVFAYNDNGGLKPYGQHPVMTRVGTANDPYEFKVTIIHYSSFVTGVSTFNVPGGGGGGGGSSNGDRDGDGLPDDWEEQYFGDDRAADPDADADGDGLSNEQEYILGTNPTSTDSDGDGVSDSEEIVAGTDPLDANDPPATTPTTPQTTPPTGPSPTPQEPDEAEEEGSPGFGLIAGLAVLGGLAILRRRR